MKRSSTINHLAVCSTFGLVAALACGDDESKNGVAMSGGAPGAGGDASGGASSGGTGTGGASSGGAGAIGAGGMGGMAVMDAAPDAPMGTPVDVSISDGPLRGTLLDGVNSFLGIPYADSTAGDNRWKAPQPVPPWTEPREATAYGKICPQNTPGTSNYDPNSDEDCLFLNVWSPNLTPDAPLPVMFWLHGGAFVFGSGGGQYEGTHLASTHNVVVVTINYRLGALGFLAHPDLSAQDPSGTSGMYGMADQIAALNWVKTNIAAFGGDPNNVTLFGESAGGRSTCVHLLSPKSRGLFHRVIMESGLCLGEAYTLEGAEATGERYAATLKCAHPDGGDTLSCLKALDPQTFVAASSEQEPGGLFFQDPSTYVFFQPIVDGDILPDQAEALFAAGQAADVPVIHGINTDELILFLSGVFGDTPVMDEDQYKAAVARRFPDDVDAIVAQYPVADYASPRDALGAVGNDAFFVCSARRMAQHLAAQGVSNYLYYFDGKLDTPVEALVGKAFHSAELPYVFGNPYALGSVPEASKPLEAAIQGYWTRFAATGDPNGAASVAWPAYETAADQYLKLADTIEVGSNLHKEKCDFWDTLVGDPGSLPDGGTP